jgi:hypothetical protein
VTDPSHAFICAPPLSFGASTFGVLAVGRRQTTADFGTFVC